MNTDKLLKWARENNLNPDQQVKSLLEYDYCDHGDEIQFIDTERKAKIITAHNIESFIKGMNRGRKEMAVGKMHGDKND